MLLQSWQGSPPSSPGSSRRSLTLPPVHAPSLHHLQPLNHPVSPLEALLQVHYPKSSHSNWQTIHNSGAVCIFPSMVAGVTLTGCTNIDGDTRPWCSTQVDSSGNQVKGQWGYCPETGCPVDTRTMLGRGVERSGPERSFVFN